MIHRPRYQPAPHIYPPDEWNMVEKQFMPDFLCQGETMFALGNGYFGMRGCFEEGRPSGENGTFINGFYETWPIRYPEEAYGFATTGQTIVNVTDAKIIKLYVDDEPFWLPQANILAFERRLNMKAATLDRDILWETPAGKRVSIKSRRLVSFVHRHVAAISYQVTLLNAEAPIVISSEMVANGPSRRRTEGDPRQSTVFAGKVLHHKASYAKDRRVVLCHGTEKSQMTLACAIDHYLNTDAPHSSDTRVDEDFGRVVFSIEARAGVSINLTKYIAYHTSDNADTDEMCARVERTSDRAMAAGFHTLLSGQEQYMEDFWRKSDIQVIADPLKAKASTIEIQQAIRFNLFHVIQASGRAENCGVPAKGLTGQAYEGHYFWDAEIYVLPFLIYTSPRIANNLLQFRYRMLEKAKERARQLSQKGAMFPWRTINGDEASAFYAAGTAAYHINADIMYAVKKYVNATDDKEFLFHQGVEMLVETARLWRDLGTYSDAQDGKFCIYGVTGPDEYTTVVDNNLYTNLMAAENLRYAADTVESLRARQPERFRALVHKTGLEKEEIEEWRRAAENMYIPYDKRLGVYAQDDTFLKRTRWDFKNTPAGKYPLLLFYHPLTIYRHQVIKQADVVLAMFLLGHAFSAEAKKRNFDYYDALTTGDSSLSACIQSIMASEVGDLDKAIDYARAAVLMDLGDVAGNVKDGCHIASMGGVWMVFVYGFAGLRDYDGRLSFKPRITDRLERLRFTLTVRGQILEVDIGRNSTTYTLQEGSGLVITHEDQDIELSPGKPVRVQSHDTKAAPRGVTAANYE